MMARYAKHGRFALLLLAIGITAAGFSMAGNDGNAAPDYRVGDRLSDTTAPTRPGPYRKMNWDDLVPADWDPMKVFKGLDLSKLEDDDPRAMEALDKLRAAWNDAPVRSELNGVRIEIPGFVVPLDVNPEKMKEFLLVPYYGACIHVPPPPSNQVLHVILPGNWASGKQKALRKAVQTYGAVVVRGTLKTVSNDTSMGISGYRLDADSIDPYIAPKDNKRRE